MAHLGVQAAEALEHAHQQGVVHRDVKPANLLVDGRGHLWVTDFGLARFPSGANLTQTGDLLGTLRYMSPEQALGRHALVGPRTDVYALGATLYELLTLHPVHEGRDRQELLRQIEREEPMPPRRRNPAVPADLETVVLKALAKEPAERYGSAQELADDLKRFLEDEPVRARRPTLRRRAAKWARRRRAAVGAGLAVVFLAVAALAAGAVLLWREQQRTAAALAQARERQRLARQAVDEVYTEVADGWLEHEPHREDLQRQFLLKALAHYRRFADEDGPEPEVRREAGRAAWRVGDIHQRLGEHAAAEAAYAEALRRFEQLAAEWVAAPDYRRDLAGCTNSLGILRATTGRPRAAEEAYRQAVALLEQLAADFPDAADYRHRLAVCHLNLAVFLLNAGRIGEARPHCLRALAAQQPGVSAYRRDLAGSLNTLGNLLKDLGRLAEAEQSYERALLVLGEQEADGGADRRSLVRKNLGSLYWMTGRLAEAEQAYREALAARRALAERFPAVSSHREHLAAGYTNLGRLLGSAGRPREAEEAYREALAHWDALAAGAPNPTAAHKLADAHDRLARLLWRAGRGEEARRAFVAAARRWGRLAEGLPDHAGAQAALAWFLATCPDAHFRDPARAAALARRAVALAPESGRYWATLGAALYRQGDYPAAADALTEAVRFRPAGEAAGFFLAMAHAQLGRPEEARAWYERAAEETRRDRIRAEALAAFQNEAAALLSAGP